MSSAERILAEHSAWVRRLALRLADDAHHADDLVQDAWIRALDAERGAAVREPRRWLSRVLRNLALQHLRGESRRRRRESAVARDEATPSTRELVERLALQRHVSEAVEALAEPHRTVVLLRHVEGLTPAQIGARLGVPASTVRSRLQRGLDKLRAALDEQHDGERRAWLLPLLVGSPVLFPLPTPVTPSSGPLPAPVVGAAATATLLMKSKLLVTVAVVVALAAATGLAVRLFPDAGAPEALAGASADPAQDPTPRLGEERVPSGPERRAVAADPSGREVDAIEPAPAAVARLRGRVLDLRGDPVADVPVDLPGRTAGDSAVRTDDAGDFELALPADAQPVGGRARVETVELTTVLTAQLGTAEVDDEAIPPVVVVAPRLEVGGVVVDESGTPVAGASLQLRIDEDRLRAAIPAILDRSSLAEHHQDSSTDGRFAFRPVPALPGAELLVTARGHAPTRLPMPATDRDDLRIVLSRPGLVDGALSGIVLTALGAPATEAWVAVGEVHVRTGTDGRFVLPLEEVGGARLVRAVQRGALPCEQPLPADLAAREPFVTLVLGAPPLSLTGRVVDHEGRPVEGLRIWADDPTPVFGVGERLVALEGYLGGGPTMTELRARFADSGPPAEMPPSALWNYARTAADGGFRIDGLLPRDYHLATLDGDRLLRTVHGPFPAGSHGLQIVLPRAEVHPVVAGVVTAPDGTPLAGVQVVAVIDAIRVPLPMADSGAATMHHRSAVAQTVTDTDGRFRLEEVAAELAYLRLDEDRILPREYGRGVAGGITAVDGRPADELRVVVTRRVHVQCTLADAGEATAVGAEDADGQRVPIDIFLGRGRRTTEAAPFEEGRTPTLAVPETVRTLLLLRDDGVVRRVPVTLGFDELNQITL